MEVFMNGPRNYRKADGIHVSCCKADGGVLRTNKGAARPQRQAAAVLTSNVLRTKVLHGPCQHHGLLISELV